VVARQSHWQGTDRVVCVDSDALARQNFDELFLSLFEMSFPFGAVPDVYGNADFKLPSNAGVLALRPNQSTFESMLGRVDDARYPPGEAEQAFLNLYFGADVIRLPYVYSANLVIRERSPVLWYAVRDEMRIVHYTSPKPFAKDGKDIVDGAPLERLINKAKHHRDGMHAEANGWWQDIQRIPGEKLVFATTVRSLVLKAADLPLSARQYVYIRPLDICPPSLMGTYPTPTVDILSDLALILLPIQLIRASRTNVFAGGSSFFPP